MASCPICGRPVAFREPAAPFPFCSARCRQVDLGRWLDERYRVAGPEVPEGHETESAPPPVTPAHEDEG